MEIRQPVPPFTLETATLKVRMAEDARNSRDPEKFHWFIPPTRAGATAPNL